MRSLTLAVLLVTGCIESSLVPCDENLCPVGTACSPSGACVSDDQLTACLGLEEREDCTVAAGPGVCMMGVCQPKLCGNGVRTPDEVCDDTNNVSGDGCAADCQSDEVCGNGITDVSMGEGCDDGNTVDEDDCRADCSLPRCGDGVLDELEQCEPAAIGSTEVSCEDFGFYEGTPTCGTQCRYIPEGCTGRCGDDVVQSAFGEECDGTPPATSCVAQGFDYGAIACSNRCVADVVGTCRRFGWTQLANVGGVDQQLTAVAGDDDVYVIISGNGITIVRDGGTFPVDGPVNAIDVVGDTVMRAVDDRIELYDDANGMITLPSHGGNPVQDAKLEADATPVALLGPIETCELARFSGGSWTRRPTISQCDRVIVLGANEHLVVGKTSLQWVRPDGGVTTWPNSAIVVGATRTGSELLVDRLLTARNTVVRGRFTQDGELLDERLLADLPPGAATVTVRGDRVFAKLQDGPATSLYASEGNRSEPLTAPDASPIGFAVARDGRLLLISTTALYSPRPLVQSDRTWNTRLIVGEPHIAVGSDNALVLCGSNVELADGAARQDLFVPGTDCTALAVRARSTIFAGRTSGATRTLQRIDAANSVTEEYAGPDIVRAIAVDDERAIALIGATVRERLDSGAWVPIPFACAVGAIALAEGEIVAVTPTGSPGCQGVHAYRNGSWTQILPASGSVTAIATARDGSLVVAQDTIRVRAVGSSTFVALPALPSAVVALAAASATDIIASTPTEGRVYAWDGVTWSPMAVPDGSSLVLLPNDLMTAQVGFVNSQRSAVFTGVVRGL